MLKQETHHEAARPRRAPPRQGRRDPQKNSNTLVKTLRKEYGENFLKGYRPNTQLGAVLKKEKVESLHDLLKSKR